MGLHVRLLSLFAGVGGFELGFESAGNAVGIPVQTVGQVEIDPYCQAVLAHHWPDVPKWSDICDLSGSDVPDCDIVAFGSPCQGLSQAGDRSGLELHSGSSMFFEAIRILKELRDAGRSPKWVVWENVRGALWSNQGSDFAQVLDLLAECGAVDIQWRVLDARFFGVPQRRRRVFVVARFDSRNECGPQIFPVSPRRPRDSETVKGKEQEVAALTAWGVGVAGPDDNQAQAGHLIPVSIHENQRSEITLSEVHPTLGNHSGKIGQGYANVFYPDHALHLTQDPICTDGTFTPSIGAIGKIGIAQVERSPELVRKLTPLECERLMGWPDHHTAFGLYRGQDSPKAISDAQRYKMCGNGVVAPVAEWVASAILRHSS